MKSETVILLGKYQKLSDQGIDWFIKSFKYQPESEEWQICRLKEKIYCREALKTLEKFEKEIDGQL